MKTSRSFWVLMLLAYNFSVLPCQVKAQMPEKAILGKKFLGQILSPSANSYITLKDVNVRKAPMTKAPKVTIIRKGIRVLAIGKAKGTKWIAIEKDGMELGFIYDKALAIVLDGQLNSALLGKLEFSGQPNCNYTIKFDSKNKVRGDLQVTSDYWVSFTCNIKGKKVKFVATMFITELPYQERKKNIFQVNVDLPAVTDDEGEVMSVTSLYHFSKEKLVFEDVSVPKMANKLSSFSKIVKTVPEILNAAVQLTYRIWGPLVWKNVASRDRF